MPSETRAVHTLTLNPAVDVSFAVDHVEPEHKLRTSNAKREPGGGGLNAARAVHQLGGRAHAVYTAGGPTGDLLVELVAGHAFPHTPVPVSGLTRENIIVDDRSSTRQFRFVLPGPALANEEVEACLRVLPDDGNGEFIILSGSLPPANDPGLYAELVSICRDRGYRVVLDASGEAFRRGCRAGVDIVKPNLRELSHSVGHPVTTDQEAEDAARLLVDKCDVQAVVVSIGAGGALLLTDELTERIASPTVRVRSKVGAGDSMVAGMVLALTRGRSMLEAARFGVAAGAAAVMTPGTELCRRDDTERLYQDMRKRAHVAPEQG